MKSVYFQMTQGEETLMSHFGLALIGTLVRRTSLAARGDEITLFPAKKV